MAGNGVLPRRVNSELRFEGDWRGRLTVIPTGKWLLMEDTAQRQRQISPGVCVYA